MSESYGGKMAAELALLLHRGIQAETIECNLVSVGLIDSWISPIDSVMAWSPYLEQMVSFFKSNYKISDIKTFKLPGICGR